MAFPTPGSVWRAARAVEKVFELDVFVRTALDGLDERLAALDWRILQLEADKREEVTEARAAAATAASVAATGHLTDLARQVGIMQEQIRALRDASPAKAFGQRPGRPKKRLAPPDDT